MENIVVRQSTQLSYSDAYLIVGLIFLCTLSMLLIAVSQKGEKLLVMLSDY